MKVVIHFYGVVKNVVNAPTETLELAYRSTLADLLNILQEKYGPNFTNRVFDDQGRVLNFVRFFLNGEEMDNLKLNVPLAIKNGGITKLDIYILPAQVGG